MYASDVHRYVRDDPCLVPVSWNRTVCVLAREFGNTFQLHHVLIDYTVSFGDKSKCILLLLPLAVFTLMYFGLSQVCPGQSSVPRRQFGRRSASHFAVDMTGQTIALSARTNPSFRRIKPAQAGSNTKLVFKYGGIFLWSGHFFFTQVNLSAIRLLTLAFDICIYFLLTAWHYSSFLNSLRKPNSGKPPLFRQAFQKRRTNSAANISRTWKVFFRTAIRWKWQQNSCCYFGAEADKQRAGEIIRKFSSGAPSPTSRSALARAG